MSWNNHRNFASALFSRPEWERSFCSILMPFESVIKWIFPPSLHSHCRDPINLAVLHLKETGELAKLQNKWWYEKTECKGDKDNPAVTRNELSLTNLAGVFYILIGGLLIALAISLVEFCFKSQKSPTTTSLTTNSMQMTDTMKPKSRLPITSARDYDNGQVD